MRKTYTCRIRSSHLPDLHAVCSLFLVACVAMCRLLHAALFRCCVCRCVCGVACCVHVSYPMLSLNAANASNPACTDDTE